MNVSGKQALFLPRARTTWRSLFRKRRIILLLGIFLFFIRTLPGRRPGALSPNGALRTGSTEEIVSCIGPRGVRISDSPDDQIAFHKLDANPQPHVGSYDALGLASAWATAEERYGPYGYRQKEGLNKRKRVKWSKVNWGELQAQCQRDNAHRFTESWIQPFNASERRLRLRDPEETSSSKMRPQQVPAQRTNRTLIGWRIYDGYMYHEEDKINLRSLISEAALQSGGEYTVMLLVNVRDSSKHIYESEEAYAKAFEEANIPEEFQSIAVLWDEQLLQNWYSKLEDHGLYNQVTQAMQLIGVFYPEFDHFWLLEPDMRSHGHFLSFLQAMDRFSRNEPRKQWLERASYFHIPLEQGPYYSGFLQSVNKSADGGSATWGPLRVPEVPHPIGPKPPVARPEDDNFEWGVGEPADLVSTGPCTWVFRSSWVFRFWFEGDWSMGDDTPRIFCPPATQRASRELLNVVHAAQMDQGLALPSESTLPSFAVFHGLKLSYPPQPVFMKNPPADSRLAEVYWNGGAPGECLRVSELPSETSELITYEREDDPPRDLYKGSACGDGLLDGFIRIDWQTSLSWSFMSDFPRQVLEVWRRTSKNLVALDGEDVDDYDDEDDEQELREDEQEAMVVLKRYDGQWYAPAGWWHPAKTNQSP